MLSEERQNHFAHLIVDGLYDDDLADFSDDDMAFKVAKRAIIAFVNEYSKIDVKVRGMVSSLKRNVPEGSPEWDVMYNKYFEEEIRKMGGG